MQCNGKWIGRGVIAAVIVIWAAGLTGCASPPSAGPLMRVVEKALQQEQAMLETDQQRTTAWMQQQRDTLKSAFDADVDEQATLDKQWVNDQVNVYVAAREALVRHELELQRQNEQRRQNMSDALTAQQRAIQVIEQQDALLAGVPDLRRWLQQQEENNGQ